MTNTTKRTGVMTKTMQTTANSPRTLRKDIENAGFTVRKRDGEYRICPKGGSEDEAYYTTDLLDARDTCIAQKFDAIQLANESQRQRETKTRERMFSWALDGVRRSQLYLVRSVAALDFPVDSADQFERMTTLRALSAPLLPANTRAEAADLRRALHNIAGNARVMIERCKDSTFHDNASVVRNANMLLENIQHVSEAMKSAGLL